MHKSKVRWDVERAAGWLRRHGWAGTGEELPAAPDQEALAAAQAGAGAEQEDIDIAGWPALVAPFYD